MVTDKEAGVGSFAAHCEGYGMPIFCPAMTHPGSRYIDPEPPEYCETKVESEGDYCTAHEEPDDRGWDE